MSTSPENDQPRHPLLSREDLLSSSWYRDQHASRLLRTIELRVAYMRAATRRVIRRHFLGDEQPGERRFDPTYLQGIRHSARSIDPVTVDDLERYAEFWEALVPKDPDTRGALTDLLLSRYPLRGQPLPRIKEALGLASDAVENPEAMVAPPGENEPLPDSTPSTTSDEQLLRDIEASVAWIHLPAGGVLFRQGEESESLYLVVTGRLRVAFVENDGSERVLRDITRDDVVGEIGALTGEIRSSTVYALRDSQVVRLVREDFVRLAQRYPQVLLRLTRMLALRLQATRTNHGGRALQTVAVAAAGAVPLAEFAAGCAEELALHGSVLHLNRAAVETALDAEALKSTDQTEVARLLAWLDEQESEYQYVLYEADSNWSEWTRLCVHQADRVLLLADADADPARSEVEAHLPARVPIELVLLHPSTRGRPAGTQRWLHSRRVFAHHHVRLGYGPDMRRMVRRLLGRAIGLVLSGGGARAFAHIGVIRFLEEMGMEIDMVGGTSMGALVGSGYARGGSYPDLLELCRRFGSRRWLLDLTLPLTSFLSGANVTRCCQAVADGWEFEDLWRPFFCVSSNITTAEQVIHDRGPLWRAVRASLAIPVAFAPILQDGHVLVDGGLMNNFPLDIMRQRSPDGTIVGVSTILETEHDEGYQFGESVSGWHMLLAKTGVLRQPVKAPSLFGTLLRSVELGSTQHMKSTDFMGLADAIIQPPVEHLGMLDFSSYQEAIEIGYRAAQESLERLQALQRLSG